jgi:hypothetical protein
VDPQVRPQLVEVEAQGGVIDGDAKFRFVEDVLHDGSSIQHAAAVPEPARYCSLVRIAIGRIPFGAFATVSNL